jgi:hypothetical protein
VKTGRLACPILHHRGGDNQQFGGMLSIRSKWIFSEEHLLNFTLSTINPYGLSCKGTRAKAVRNSRSVGPAPFERTLLPVEIQAGTWSNVLKCFRLRGEPLIPVWSRVGHS